MSTRLVIENLREVIEDLSQARRWLERSFAACKPFEGVAELTDEQLDEIEAFTSRFGRVTDILVQKSFRAIDAVELEQGGMLIDAVLRAEKRGIVESAEQVRAVRELRNTIAHEYRADELAELFRQALAATPGLQATVDRCMRYCERYLDAAAGTAVA